MARNLLGEKKENRKEGGEGRKTDQQTVGEDREFQNIIYVPVQISSKSMGIEIYRLHVENST